MSRLECLISSTAEGLVHVETAVGVSVFSIGMGIEQAVSQLMELNKFFAARSSEPSQRAWEP
jgi:hypothetical protein